MNKYTEISSGILGLVGTTVSLTDITNIINLLLLIVSLINILIVCFFNIKKHIENKEYEKIPEELKNAQNALESLKPKEEEPALKKVENNPENCLKTDDKSKQ